MASANILPEVRDREWACQLFANIVHERNEAIGFAYFSPDWRYLGMRHCASGGATSVTVPMRDVARDVLTFDARLVLMAHNHPSGDHRPSDDDLAVTARLARMLDTIGTRLVDHLILGGDGCTSLFDEGYL